MGIDLRRRAISSIALLAALSGCDLPSGTGGRAVEIEVRLRSLPQGDRPLGAFVTRSGWEVHLSEAFVALGPIYLYEQAPHLAGARRPGGSRLWDLLVRDAHAHAGDQHFSGGEVKGEWLGQIAFDALAEGGAVLGRAPGTAGPARSLSVSLDPPRASILGPSDALRGHHAYVAGEAAKDGLVVPFEGGLLIEDEGTKRSVDGVALDAALDDGVVVTLELHLEAWFDEAHFDRLAEAPPGGRRLITPDSQVRTAWFIGARSAAAFSTRVEEPP
jgi:hypothetical protein